MSVGMYDDSFTACARLTVRMYDSRPVLDCVDGYECEDV